MAAKTGAAYQYNRAEWSGVFLALVGTPPLCYQLLGEVGLIPTTSSLAYYLGFGGMAVAGWTLLLLGTRAHRRAASTPAA
jgi:hypothetical protein